MSKYVFFLGGRDAEMVRIAELLFLNGCEFCDKRLSSGAHSTDYKEEIERAISQGKIIVLVEVSNLYSSGSNTKQSRNKIALPKDSILISHKHDINREYESLMISDDLLSKKVVADMKKSSLMKVLNLIRVKPTRLDLLIATNDLESLPGLISMKATPSEIRDVRSRQRKALGVTFSEEFEAEEAAFNVEYVGKLSIVRVKTIKLKMVSGCSTITDRLTKSAGGVGWDNLLLLSESTGEVMFFGAANLCYEINKAFFENRNVYTQTLGGIGCWGGHPDHAKLVDFITKLLPVN